MNLCNLGFAYFIKFAKKKKKSVYYNCDNLNFPLKQFIIINIRTRVRLS